jgi:hypothetical protein
MKITKGLEAQQVVDRFQHDLIHSEELLKLYPDLSIVAKSASNSLHEVEYFSTKIATEVDSCDFNKESTSAYLYTHVIHPYKNVRINCTKCDGVVRVNSDPHRVPLFLEHETVFKKEYIISCFVYEDLFKFHNFNSKVLSNTQLYIISKLDEHSTNNNKLDLLGLSNSIKLLLPFT